MQINLWSFVEFGMNECTNLNESLDVILFRTWNCENNLDEIINDSKGYKHVLIKKNEDCLEFVDGLKDNLPFEVDLVTYS